MNCYSKKCKFFKIYSIVYEIHSNQNYISIKYLNFDTQRQKKINLNFLKLEF